MSDRPAILRRSTCKFCQQPIVFGLLANGRYRSFQPELAPAADAAEGDRFGVSRKRGCVVDLLGERNPPPLVLVMHICREYGEERRMRGIAQLGDLTDSALPRNRP